MNNITRTYSSFRHLVFQSLHKPFSDNLDTLLDGNIDQCYTGKLKIHIHFDASIK